MRWVGTGTQLYRVRVDLFAADEASWRVSTVFATLKTLLIDGDREFARGDCGADQGTGVAGEPVVGLGFWVRADDVGGAADIALATARAAGAEHGAGPGFFGVTVVPREAVRMPDDPMYAPRSD